MKLHIVFPKNFIEQLASELENEGLQIVDRDTSLDTFSQWATSKEENHADVAFIYGESVVSTGDSDSLKQSIYERLKEVRISRPNLRLLVLLTPEIKKDKGFLQRITSLGIYDIHFAEEIDTDMILEWLNTNKSLADVQDLIGDYIETEITVEKVETGPDIQEENITEKAPNSRLERKQKIKIVEKEVIHTEYKTISSKVIVIGSLYRGAGSTLLATNLARMIGSRGIDVSYVEHPLIKPYMFDYLQMHAEEKPYYDVSRELVSEGVVRSKREAWEQYGVTWNVIDSRQPSLKSFTYKDLLVLTHTINSNIIILDISDRWLDEEVQKFIYAADHIYLCVEPDPIKLDWSIFNHSENRNKEKLILDFLNGDLKLSHYEMITTKNLEIKEWKDMLHKRPIAKLPYIPYEDVMKSVYQSKLLYDAENYNELFEEALKPLLISLVPKEFLNLKSTPSGKLLNKLLAFKKK